MSTEFTVIYLFMAFLPLWVVILFILANILITKVGVKESRRRVQEIMADDTLLAKEKGQLLLEECNELFRLRDAKYRDELLELTNKYLEENNFKLGDFL